MSYPIPNAALDDRLGFVGTSGSGKTYAAGTAVERLLERKARVVIVDPLGVWFGLRIQADGKAAAPPPPPGSVWEIFRTQLGQASEAIIQWLLEVGGEATREQIAAAVSIELNGSTMRARLAELRKLEAIEDLDRQRIRVQPWLADNWGREA